MDVLRRVLEASPPASTPDTLRAWWDATAPDREPATTEVPWGAPTTVDRALVGGAQADRLGFAFAVGYSEALRAMLPGLRGINALCATEEGGNHPRAIKTTLTRVHDQGFLLNGRKTWATAAPECTRLLVIASTGEVDGKNQLVMVSVRPDERGVTLSPASAPFVPEIPHAQVTFDGVQVHEADVHGGDAYDEYLKPFRTIEDTHVHAALVGYLIGVARRHEFLRDVSGSLFELAAAARTISTLDVKAATTHVALGGLIEHAVRVVADVEARWSEHASNDAEWTRWQRDRPLLKVAGAARTARLARAREQLGMAK
jgi:hypothetical protein